VTRALPLLGAAPPREAMGTQSVVVESAEGTFTIELSAPRARLHDIVDDLRRACDAQGLRCATGDEVQGARRLRIVVGTRPDAHGCDLVVTRWTQPLATALGAQLARL
jgi:hypothetical protein